MIEWIPFVFNTIWITGLALLLTTAGWQLSNRPVGAFQPEKIFTGLLNQKLFWWGWAATSAGMSGVSQAAWQQIIWLLLCLTSAVIAFQQAPKHKP